MNRPTQHELPLLPTNDYHQLPVTEKQLAFARAIAQASGQQVPDDALSDRRALSQWIDRNHARGRSEGRFDAYPSSRQVAFAERIARLKRRAVPPECFRDRALMSKWIDSNR